MTAPMTPQRAIDPDDWPALLSLLHRAFAYMDGIIDPPSSLHGRTAQGIALQARKGEVWVIGQPALACVFLTPDRTRSISANWPWTPPIRAAAMPAC